MAILIVRGKGIKLVGTEADFRSVVSASVLSLANDRKVAGVGFPRDDASHRFPDPSWNVVPLASISFSSFSSSSSSSSPSSASSASSPASPPSFSFFLSPSSSSAVPVHADGFQQPR